MKYHSIVNLADWKKQDGGKSDHGTYKQYVKEIINILFFLTIGVKLTQKYFLPLKHKCAFFYNFTGSIKFLSNRFF